MMGKVIMADSLFDRRREENQRARIEELWLEWRVSGQYEKCWRRVESGLELAAVLRGVETPGSIESDQRDSVSASYRFMEMTDGPPSWFRTLELGIGTVDSYFDTQIDLPSKNARRRATWLKLQAAEVREFVSRTVKG
jgi:hypothetical protein